MYDGLTYAEAEKIRLKLYAYMKKELERFPNELGPPTQVMPDTYNSLVDTTDYYQEDLDMHDKDIKTIQKQADELEQIAIELESVLLVGHIPFEVKKIRKVKDKLIILIGGGGTGTE